MGLLFHRDLQVQNDKSQNEPASAKASTGSIWEKPIMSLSQQSFLQAQNQKDSY